MVSHRCLIEQYFVKKRPTTCFCYRFRESNHWYYATVTNCFCASTLNKKNIVYRRCAFVIESSLLCIQIQFRIRRIIWKKKPNRLYTLTKGQCSKRWTILSVLAVHRPFYISICISTLPTQHTTFMYIYIQYTMHSN